MKILSHDKVQSEQRQSTGTGVSPPPKRLSAQPAVEYRGVSVKHVIIRKTRQRTPPPTLRFQPDNTHTRRRRHKGPTPFNLATSTNARANWNRQSAPRSGATHLLNQVRVGHVPLPGGERAHIAGRTHRARADEQQKKRGAQLALRRHEPKRDRHQWKRERELNDKHPVTGTEEPKKT